MTASRLTIAEGEEHHEAVGTDGVADPSAGDCELVISDAVDHTAAVLMVEKLLKRLKESEWPNVASGAAD